MNRSSYVPWTLYRSDLQHPTEAKLRSLASLPEGWDFGRGVPADRDCLSQALSLHHSAMETGFSHSDCFPADDGSVMVTLYVSNLCLEFSFEVDGRIVFVLEEDDVEKRETDCIDLAAAVREVRNVWKGQWKSYVSLASGTTTFVESGSAVPLFATPAGTGAYQLYADSA